MKALDLFCGAGGASMGLHYAGFDVTGVDIVFKRDYPFKFIHADALSFSLDNFDFIWASPPCQSYSAMKHAPGARGAPRLIADIRQRLIDTGKPYCIENVEGAKSEMINPIKLCGTCFKLGAQGCELQRHRLFECNFAVQEPPCMHSGKAVIGVYGGHARKRSAKYGGRGTKDIWAGGHKAAASEAMGINWMTLSDLSEAIPPVYAYYIAKWIRK